MKEIITIEHQLESDRWESGKKTAVKTEADFYDKELLEKIIIIGELMRP